MPVTNQVLHWAEFRNLKNLKRLDRLQFDASPLTAITGANGAGKSTVLHALACAFEPLAERARENYRFPDFFLPTSDSRWQGSEFELCYSYRDGQAEFENITRLYRKAEDRWTPRYSNRPHRHLHYIGVRSCVPKIEEERATSFLDLDTVLDADDLSRQVRAAASRVLNRDYAQSAKRGHWTGKTYRGVVAGGLAYSSLSMGAGEQRVFEILERIYAPQKNTLFLIDELDLLLHEDALQKLIDVIFDRATDKGHQIIFTTHRESVLSRGDKICVHHIFSSSDKTLSLPATHPDVWHRLTGTSLRPLEVFVEDDLGAAIVAREADLLQIRRHVSIAVVGAATNIFTLASGFALQGALRGSHLFLTDGDVYKTSEEREGQVAKVLTGNGQAADTMRESVLAATSQFRLPDGYWPEKLVHEFLINLSDAEIGHDIELVEIAREIGIPAEKHGFVDNIVNRLGHSREVGLLKVIEVASRSIGWPDMVASVRAWLEAKRGDFAL